MLVSSSRGCFPHFSAFISSPSRLNAVSAFSLSCQKRPTERRLRRSPLRVRAHGAEEHESSLLSHGCCGTASAIPSKTNPLHQVLSKAFSSFPVFQWLSHLHHSRFGAGIVLAGLLMYITPVQVFKKWLQFLGVSLVMGFSGVPLFRSALLQLCRLEVDASVLMSLSALGSVYLGMTGEGLLLLVLFQISHLLEAKFTNQSQTSLHALLHSVPDKARVVKVAKGTMEPELDAAEMQDAADVSVGSFVLVKPGEQVPLDGRVVFGSASVTVEHVFGESLPVLVRKGMDVAAGSHNADGLLVLETLATVEDSTPTRIAQLGAKAQMLKPPLHRWIDRVTALWSRCALLTACGVALLCVAMGVPFFGPRGALYRSLCFVTAAAPCSLILTPLAYVCALANASQRRILVKSAAILDALHSCSYVALDKTGTLTEGKLVCTDIVDAEDILPADRGIASVLNNPRKHKALCHAVDLSKRSTHPTAAAIVDAGRQHLPAGGGHCSVADFELVPGFGVKGTIVPQSDHQSPLFAALGSLEFVQHQLPSESEKTVSTVQHQYGKSISVLTMQDAEGQNLLWSAFCFRDELQAASKAAVQALQQGSWKDGKPTPKLEKQVSIVTGDRDRSAQSIGQTLNVRDVLSQHSPEEKLRFVQSTQAALREKTPGQSGVVMVGDGMNDAPALAQADVGISISTTATDISATASDIVLLNGQGVANLPFLFLLAQRLRIIVVQNLVLTFSAMLVVCVPTLRGWMPLWLTVVFHEGSTLLTAMNSCRLLFLKPPQ